MDHLYISCYGFVISKSHFWRVRLWAISNILSYIPLFDEIDYLLFELKTIFSVVPMISVELTILVLVSLAGVSFDFTRPLD